MRTSHNKSYFDNYSHHHAYHYDNRHNDPGVYNSIFSYMKNSNKSNNMIKILDVGCGDGPFIRSMLTTGVNAFFTGFDLSLKMLRTAKKTISNTTVELVAADGFNMPLRKEARFDLIHIDSVLHHLVGTNRAESMRLVNLFCTQLRQQLSEKGILVVEEVYYVSYLFPKLTSSLIFYGLKLLNFLHLDASRIVSELLPGLEVNFLGDKEIEKLLSTYGRVYLIKKTPWQRPNLYRLLLLKDFGHISYVVTVS
jgi:SAM-dependent methyltransferase